MSESRFTLSNFKAFGSAIQTIPLRPITLVFGPNSTGKSSILHALAWLQHGFSEGELDVQVTRRTGIDLGGFDQMVHRHQAGTRPIVGWSIPGSRIMDGVGGWNLFDRFDLELTFHRMDGEVRLVGINVASPEGLLMRATLREELAWRIDLMNWEHPAMAKLLASSGSPTPAANGDFDTALAAGLYEIEIQDFIPSQLVTPAQPDIFHTLGGWLTEKAIPGAFRLLFDAFRREFVPQLREMNHIPPLRELPPRGFDPSRSSDSRWRKLASDNTVLERVNDWLAPPQPPNPDNSRKNRYRLDLVRFFRRDAIQRSLSEIIHDAFINLMATDVFGEDAEWHLDQLKDRWMKADRGEYLRRCPAYLERLTDNEMDSFRDSGEDFWLEMDEKEQREYAEQVAIDIASSDYAYFTDSTPEPHFIEFMKEDQEFLEFLSSRWDQEKNEALLSRSLDVADTEQRTELLLKDLRTGTVLALQDVGVGISQILPILISAYGLNKNLVAIEQPEIHIHPALQAELGDVFIESALGANKNTFLLETHSEHLILRILRRIRETTRNKLPEGAIPVRCDDIAVLYVEPGEDGSVVRELRVNDQGRFIDDWPNGFFEERFNEEF